MHANYSSPGVSHDILPESFPNGRHKAFVSVWRLTYHFLVSPPRVVVWMSLSIPSQIQCTVGTYLSPKSTNWGLAEVMRNLLAVALDASHTSSLKNQLICGSFGFSISSWHFCQVWEHYKANKRPWKTSSFPMKLRQNWWKWVNWWTFFMSHKIMRKRRKGVLLFTDICFFAQLSLQLFRVKTWNC